MNVGGAMINQAADIAIIGHDGFGFDSHRSILAGRLGSRKPTATEFITLSGSIPGVSIFELSGRSVRPHVECEEGSNRVQHRLRTISGEIGLQ